MNTALTTRLATGADLPELAGLFDAHRQFHELPSDVPAVRAFLEARVASGEARICVAQREGQGALLGFALICPTWCFGRMARTAMLNDLYVSPNARRCGVGRVLMLAAREEATQMGAVMMDLFTAHTNTEAQALYESLGWELDTTLRYYSLYV
ncbi:GNAT family N-acetyltransferase [Ideonella paludis]|uniref:GNAT family N-acetyltransferase n=1 Tax=Ideonella paludis TaxID=1233411 RepID=A0ABS5E2F3_9BURK|nr:GNAT family N-acetyltransferase [Ideonella paludis]MBQ0937578.1 GNAT family N-acetyltransferase [Ideonella paludis]